MTIGGIATATLALFSTAVLAASQAPHSPIQRVAARPAAQLSTPAQTTTVLVGCLYRETQVSGDPDGYDGYILADATTPAAGPSRPATSDAIGTSGIVPTTGSMYEIENMPDSRLEGFVGMRVELTGMLDLDDDLWDSDQMFPEFEAETIRGVAGTCPPTPTPGR